MNTITRSGWIVALASASLLAASPTVERFLDSPDGVFVTQMSGVNAMALTLAHMAADRAANPDIKNLAARIVDDRSRIAGKLDAAVAQRGVRPAPEMTPYQRTTIEWIETTRGTAFDREYVQAAVLALGNAVERFQSESSTGSDPFLISLATSELPALRADRTLAKALIRVTS